MTSNINANENKPGQLLRRQGELSPEARAAFDKMRAERAAAEAERPAIQAAGVEALRRLVEVAQGSSGQCRYVVRFLLGLYNGFRFPFDLTDFRCLDRALFKDCMAVLAMDFQPRQEVHQYFDDGGALWESMAKRWNVQDRSADRESY